MSMLSDKIAQLSLTAKERDAQVLEICALLNTPNDIDPQIEIKQKLNPVLIPHLIEEGILPVSKLHAIAEHRICSEFLKSLVKDHYNGATELTPTIEQLVAAGRTFGILTENDAHAVRDRLDLAKVVEADRTKPLENRRYAEWTEPVLQPPASWAQTHLGRSVNGDEILQILGELYGDSEESS